MSDLLGSIVNLDQSQRECDTAKIFQPPINSDRPTAEAPIKSLRPGPNVVFVSVLEQDGKSPGGIYLPQNQMEAPSQAIVEFIGEIIWTKDVKFAPKVGDRVLIKRFGHSNQRVNGKMMYGMDIKDVLAIVD